MRLVILLILTSISVSLYSQQTGSPGFLTQIGSSTDGSVKACLLVDKNGYGKELFIYRNGKTWDTLSIAREGNSYIGDTCFIQTVEEKNACSFSMPDHKPGVYVLKSEQFVRAGE